MWDKNSSPFSEGLKASAPIAISFLFSFITVGAVGHAARFSFGQTVGMTALVFAGPAQYVVMTLFASGEPALGLLTAVFLVNLRFTLMALGLTELFRGVSLVKILAAIPMLSNSTFAVTQIAGRQQQSSSDRFGYFLGVCAGSYPVAIASTALGFAIATLLPSEALRIVPVILPLYFIILLAKDSTKRLSLICAIAAAIATPAAHLWYPTWGRFLAIFAVTFGFSAFTRSGERNET